MYRCISAGVAGCPNSEANADYATPGWLPRLISGTDGAGQPVASPLLSRSTPDEVRDSREQDIPYFLQHTFISASRGTCISAADVRPATQGKTEGHPTRGDARLQSSRAAPGQVGFSAGITTCPTEGQKARMSECQQRVSIREISEPQARRCTFPFIF